VTAADLNVVTSLVAPKNIPVDAREFEQLAGIESFVLSTLRGQESFDATEFQASDDSSKSTLAFDAETTTLEQGRTITNDTSADGAGALLAVVDTGLTYDSDIYGRTVTVDGSETTESRVHEESTNFVAAGDPTVAAEGVDILDDASGHGSWVTAAAASSAPKPYRGVAPDADLYIGRALDHEDGSGAVADIATAVRAATTDAGADATCMSLGSPLYTEELADAIAYATEHGNTIVVASGNDRMVSRFVAYPAADPNTLSVSATDVPASGDPTDVRSASFANVAPHRDRQLLGRRDERRRGRYRRAGDGSRSTTRQRHDHALRTSMAAPDVAGAAALLATEGVDDPAERLRETARPVPNLAPAESRHGLLDIQAALQNDQPEDEPADVLTDDAELRDDIFRGEAAARGSWLATFL